MAQRVYLNGARRDLRGILEYIAKQSRNAARAREFVCQLQDQCRLIAENPQIGRERSELRLSIRSLATRGYAIFYEEREDHIAIVNVLHGHRDIEACFRAHLCSRHISTAPGKRAGLCFPVLGKIHS